MAHNKLYRNFIILQEDDRGSSSNEKALSGYAKVEAKGDKCKVSFYAQNLNKENNYSMILICSKKDCRQLIDLGRLEVNEVGKGDTSKEYYVNNIAGLGISYEKISGAAICINSGNEMTFIMHGFMNGEETNENWKKYKVVKDIEISNRMDKKTDLETIRKEPAKVISHEQPQKNVIEAKIIETKVVEPKVVSHESTDNNSAIKENIVTEEVDDNLEIDALDNRNSDEEERCKKCKEKDKDKKYCSGDEIKKIYDKLEDCVLDINIKIPNMKEDMVIYGFIKKKSDDDQCWKRFKSKIQCKRDEEYIAESIEKSRRIEENTRLDRIDFEGYEKSIENINKEQTFSIKGEEGKYFERIARGFEVYKGSVPDINYCKWYRVNVNNMNDLCNKSDYDKYTLAYYPMLNYYPYINKENYFLLGYKCNSIGELQYIIYGIPGSKSSDEQPYGGKTGFVTWANDGTRNNGYWLMFYDYKKCSIVVPTE
ncbi:hypothetical protein [uncultured Clostridium sp.]|uniref:DUF7922 domain-containing protein n=1 Tax=uncultured Clostridium sp. TaxID=59620 RepID=UPI0025F66CD3|nr:hypothetical protein [uncultured Clostridium sp.]